MTGDGSGGSFRRSLPAGDESRAAPRRPFTSPSVPAASPLPSLWYRVGLDVTV